MNRKPKDPKVVAELLKAGKEFLHRVLTEPRGELNRWELRARFAYDLSRYGVRKLRRDRAPQMAAALAYRTLFGLLPVLVVGTLVVRALGGFILARERIAGYLEAAGLGDYRVESSDGNSTSLADWLVGLLSQVENLDLTAVTWVGVVVLGYSAVSLMVEIENSLNMIYRAPRGRPWTRRLPIYWTLLTLGPVALGLAFYLGRNLDDFLAGIARAIALLAIMFAVYKWVPNTRVTARAALAGAVAATILLSIASVTMGAYLSNALAVRQLYGSLGLLPLFMLWVYVMWLMVLFGVEVAAAVQKFRGRELEEELADTDMPRVVDPASVLAVIQVLVQRFELGKATTSRLLADATGVDERTIAHLLPRLEEEGVVHRLDSDDGAFALAMPPDALSPADLLEIGFELTTRGTAERLPVIERLRQAQRELLEKSGTELLRPPPSADPVVEQ